MFSILDVNLADAGYFINLDRSTERLSNVNNQIQQFNIKNLYRFPAVSNIDIPQASATDSHLAVFRECLSNNIETVAVFEDDFQFYDNVSFMRSYSIETKIYLEMIKNDLDKLEWDILFLGFNPKKKCIPITKNIARVFRSTGAWGYLIKKRAYKYLLETTNYGRDRLAIDDLLPYMTYLGFNSFATILPICNHGINFVSTLQPSLGPVNYSEWILGNYHKNIWGIEIDHNLSLTEHLDKIYDITEFARNYYVEITNFAENAHNLEQFDNLFPQYKNCIIHIPGVLSHGTRYYINVESSNLIHSSESFETLSFKPANKQIIEL